MTLSTGSRLSHYEIISQLGKGGMGEVYQAKDTKLGRSVAIKVLPEEFASDVDRVARFQREAKLLASLNHPNIAAIYGLEESTGIHFLVMELVEGQTLDERIKSGPIPVEEALKLALQIAEALEAAHEKGVIHRDLKPANIKVTPEDKVKVLDFGLAKAFAGDPENLNLSNSPTLSDAATQAGVILGTAAYMSPEQARGKSVDKRTDIWAFGVVLYEMLTGRSLFAGEDFSSTLARVLEREPDFLTLPAKLHPRLRLLLERCLVKDLQNRYHDISDARVDIQSVLVDPSGVFVQPVTVEERRTELSTILSWIAAVILVGIIVGVTVWTLRTPGPPQVVHFSHELPDGQQFNQWFDLAVSPDNRHFVYSTTEGFYLRPMDRLDGRLLKGTDEDSIHPSFSPDGQWISFWSSSEGKIKKVAISGGVPITLCETSTYVMSVNWMPDDTIVFTDVLGGGIKRISADGGTPEILVEMDIAEAEENGIPSISQMLPDGKTVLFNKHIGEDTQIVVHSLESGKQTVLLEEKDVRWGFYLHDGYFIYELERALYAVPFNPETLEFKGGHVIVLEGYKNVPPIASKTLAYIPGSRLRLSALPERTLVWVDRKGNEEPLAAPPANYQFATVSPDGTRLALQINPGENEDIWIWDIARETMKQLTLDESNDFAPIWTPDNLWIIFSSEREGTPSIFRKKADGSGVAELLSEMPDANIWPMSISNDGKTLIIESYSKTSGYNIGMVPMEGDDHTPQLLLQEEYDERAPMISPDGRWLAYSSNRLGRNEIFVRPFPNVDEGEWRISTDGGGFPVWSSDSRELFYRGPEGIMSVSVESGPAFEWDTPKPIYTSQYELWDILPEDDRFLMTKPQERIDAEESAEEIPRKINIILNWFEELKELVPVD